MIAAIMQPYFLPYIGYYQMAHKVDVFVIYDTVQYVRAGWINRNRCQISGHERWITLPTRAASSRAMIEDVEVVDEREKLIKMIDRSYPKRMPGRRFVETVMRDLKQSERKLPHFLGHLLASQFETLGIFCQVVYASEIDHDRSATPVERLAAICSSLGASVYVNLPGGRALYDHEDFDAHGIQLKFIAPDVEFLEREHGVPNAMLSILDIGARVTPSDLGRAVSMGCLSS